jgi:hypothetical protein
MWKQLSRNTKIIIGVSVLLVVAGLVAGYYLYSPLPPVQQTYAPAQQQIDGSVMLEKKPDAAAKPAMVIPPGAKVERVVKFTVQAKTPINTISGTAEVKETITYAPAPAVKMAAVDWMMEPPKTDECPPVNLEMALIRDEDGQQRVIAKAENGEILSAVDIPVENVAPAAEPPKWAAGMNFEPFNQTAGVWVDRDLGPLRVGVEVNQVRYGNFGNLEGRVKVGIRF